MGELIGTVAALARFPVKSMGGEDLAEVALGWSGIAGDRQWAFVRDDGHRRFPWFTGRDFSPLIAHRACYPDGADPKMTKPVVTAPDGWSGPIDDSILAERLAAASGHAPRLIQLGRGAHDSMPLSLESSAGHAGVEARHGAAIDPRRFRVNIAIEADQPMRAWAGRRLRFGGQDGPLLALTAPIDRCVMITIDPDTGARDPAVMRTVARHFGNAYGVHGNVLKPGLLVRGASVSLDG